MPQQPSPREIELSQELARATAQLGKTSSELAELRMENKLLRAKIDALVRRLFGASSEKLDPTQLLLLLQGFDEPGKAPEPMAAEARRSTDPSPPRSDRGPRWPTDLPVVQEVIDPEPVKACPEAWRCIGEEVTEQLDYEPARFIKRLLVRRKYVRRDQPFAAPILAPLDSRAAACLESIIPGSFRGTVQSDGYAAYATFARKHNAAAGNQAITLAGCWAHARRGFFEARESAPRTCGWVLHQIALLYAIYTFRHASTRPVNENRTELWMTLTFKALPLFLDLGGLRVVHASWDAGQIGFLNGNNRLTDELLLKSAEKGTPEYRAIEVLLKGPEIRLPDGYMFTDKGGLVRRDIRVRWWLGGEGHTFHSLCMPESETVPKLAVPATTVVDGYAATEPPVILGHYWLPPAAPELLAPNVACVDYSVAKEGGMLVAYRWDGESVLDRQKFVSVSRGASVEKSFKVLVDDNFHHMDEDERYELGDFPTLQAAIAASKQIVDDFLLSGMKQGTTAKELYSGYVAFGEDPWIATGDGVRHFSAWDYAKRRCDEICGK